MEVDVSSNYDGCISGFEAAKRFTTNGIEYWMARSLMPLLGYASWDKFDGVIERAITAARSAGAPADNHFSQTGNMIQIGKGAERERADWYLSRYACYLIAMNADSSKPEVGHAMTYFAGKTRQMELLEQHVLEQQERVRFRLRTIANNNRLAGAAKKAGVIHYDRFQDAGYRGFYGMGLADIHAEDAAIHTHREAGEQVRALMQRDNGKNPEDLAAEPSIKKFVRQHRKQIKSAKA